MALGAHREHIHRDTHRQRGHPAVETRGPEPAGLTRCPFLLTIGDANPIRLAGWPMSSAGLQPNHMP